VRIEHGKLSVELFCRIVVGGCRCLCGVKEPEMNGFIVAHDPSVPLADVFVPRHTFKAARVIGKPPDVMAVLRSSAPSEIIAPIIQRITVSMVALFSPLAFENLAMHEHGSMWVFVPDSVVALGESIPLCAPIPLHQPIKIFGINDGILFLREWNEAVRFVQRLIDGVSCNTLFWHGSYSQ